MRIFSNMVFEGSGVRDQGSGEGLRALFKDAAKPLIP
jgi:hypothetical protein